MTISFVRYLSQVPFGLWISFSPESVVTPGYIASA
jgi:hypothetical protein